MRARNMVRIDKMNKVIDFVIYGCYYLVVADERYEL
jgi:hypothetical protein